MLLAEFVLSTICIGFSAIAWLFKGPNTCICDCSVPPESAVLALLKGQLDRCGPDKLGPPLAESSWTPWFLGLVVYGSLCCALVFLLGRRTPDTEEEVAIPLALSDVTRHPPGGQIVRRLSG